MTKWHIAQLNVATAVAPLDSPGLLRYYGRACRHQCAGRNLSGFCMAASERQWKCDRYEGDR